VIRALATSLCAAAALLLTAPVAGADFGFEPGTDGFAAAAIAPDAPGSPGVPVPATLAGSHPYQLSFEVGLNASGPPGVGHPDGDLRDLEIELPTGMLLNPSAVPACASPIFATPRVSPFDPGARSGENCPASTQLGTVEVQTSAAGGEPRRFGAFNVEAPHGVAARIGFAPYGAPIVFDLRMTPVGQGRYRSALSASDVPQSFDIHGFELVLWGVPWGVSHNGERGNCLNEAEPEFPWAKCPPAGPPNFPTTSYLTLPSECAPQLAFAAAMSSWQGGEDVAQALNLGPGAQPAPIGGCASVPFDPKTEAFLRIKRASSGSGFLFRASQDLSGLTSPSHTARAPAPTRRLTVALPPGATVNTAVGAGLGACSPAQFTAESASSIAGRHCPDSSKIGEFRARTPLFEGAWFEGTEWLEGAVYLAEPDDPTTPKPGAENPFDSLLAVYLVTRSPKRGLIVKLAGRIHADRHSGDLTAVFDDLPQLPYTDLELDLKQGQRPFLVSPPRCGQAQTRVTLAPWAGAGPQSASIPSQIDRGHDDGPCPSGTPPFEPTAVSGGVNAQVGTYTPYFIRLSRRDSEQEITSYSLVLPKGVTGKLAGIPFCPDAAIAAARHRRGFDELASPSCPAASRVGGTETGYGVGQALAYAPGQIYLAGPYNGKPLSLVSINAAVLGPFDLGTYVIRSAFAVDKRTAQLRIDAGASDPIPHIVDGIPLHLRDIRIQMDRPQFTRNPSSCAASELTSTLTGSGARYEDPSDDSSVTLGRHFQLFNCLSLGFRPKLGLRLRGGSRRGAYPQLRATFASRGDVDSNLKRIEVSTPRSLFIANEHIRGVCTKAQFEAEACPRRSVYGKAVAHTPLFDEPLRGEVYLRSSSSNLPDLVALLRGGEIRIAIEGRIGPAKGGGVRAFFDELPDAPISRFTMTLHGGKRGLLVNSVNICRAPPRARVRALGQNNIGAVFSSKLRGQCKKKHKRKRHGHTRKGRR
jgi:hypothetical protein